MAIITSAGSPTKGTPLLLTLNKANLASHILVAADSYFSVNTNWASIILIYKSTSSNQQEIVKFNADDVTPTAYANISTVALGDFYIQKLFIKDKQHGTFVLDRSDLVTNEFDLIYGSSMSNDWDTLFNYVTTTGGGQLKHTGTSGQNGWNNVATNSNPISGDFTFSGSIKTALNGMNEFIIGYKDNLIVSASSTASVNIRSGLYVTSGNQVNSYAGTNSTISSDAYPPFTSNQTYSFEIKRVGSLITFKFDNVLVGQETYSGDAYILCEIYLASVNGDTELLSTTLI
jgi:hypothetical protein